MVNETNKPQECLENDQLSRRLVASNQALASMQAEHRQLLAEMEQLRKRAEDLQRIREQQDHEEEEKTLEYEQNLSKATETLADNAETENFSQDSEEQKKENNEEDDPEEADYIKEKLAEIARLKAQFKRVQHMINTTELIENHIGKNQAAEKQLPKLADNTKAKPGNVSKPNLTTVPITGVAAADPEAIIIPAMPSMNDLNAATTSDEKEQLILTMLNMFQDFSSDLKSQAENLRGERARIKELKESIIRSRKEQPK